MSFAAFLSNDDGLVGRLRSLFRARDVVMHDGSKLRHFRVSPMLQVAGLSTAILAVVLSVLAVAQFAGLGTIVQIAVARDAEIARMSNQVETMRRDFAQLKHEAAAHAAQVDARQAFLAAVITGKGNPGLPNGAVKLSAAAAAIEAPMSAVEGRQAVLALQAMNVIQARYQETAGTVRKLGLDPVALHEGSVPAMGGPYEPVDPAAARSNPDQTFRALFQSWKQLDSLQRGMVAVPSMRPVDSLTFTSNFGVRSDPFRGGAAMHAGVDIPGPIGTPIYATADGVVGRAERVGGYGNLVEIEHGRGLQTRYGHLSAILVSAGQKVTRGQLIARMGSTGRSTGPHLHYEVRMDGHAMNPMPFLQSASYLAAMQAAPKVVAPTAVGGPISGE